MKMKIIKGSRIRLLSLSIICGSLLVTLVYMRQQVGGHQWTASSQTSDIESSLIDARQPLDAHKRELSSYQMMSYGQAIGKQHERRRNNDDGSGKTAKKSAQPQDDVQAQEGNQEEANINQAGPLITVRLSDSGMHEQVPIEQYVLGVTLAELPGSFETEAVKAQMLAARTYIVHRLLKHQEGDGKTGAFEVSDTTADQVYMSKERIEQYKQEYPQYYKKFVEALKQTEGLIISYNEQPIDAVFFSTSNGYTEDAEQVWGQQVSYLQSVASPWDQEVSPKYETTVEFTFSEIYEKLNLKQSRRNGKLTISNVVKNDSGRVKELTVNGASFTGRELREKLALASTALRWKIDEQEGMISFICYGYGHGIGLSQWGANGMAMQGYVVDDIIKHYYSGVDIVQASKFVNEL